MYITFMQDVPSEDGASILYAAGYHPDVSDDVARKWIGKGVAKAGIHQVEAQKPAAPAPKRRLEVRNAAMKPTDISTAGTGAPEGEADV